MPVTAISTPRHPEWRWRISDYAGTTLEESEGSFASIAAAVAAGRRRLRTIGPLEGADVAAGRRHYSSGAARGRGDHER